MSTEEVTQEDIAELHEMIAAEEELRSRAERERQLLTPGQVQEYLGCGKNLVYDLIQTGRLPALNISTSTRPSWRIRRGDLEALRFEPRPEALAPRPKIGRPRTRGGKLRQVHRELAER